MKTPTSSTFQVGDIVWAGKSSDPAHAVTWEIRAIYAAKGANYALLRSGQTGRLRKEHVANLTKFTPRLQEPA